jgi:type VI secretion system protein ImpL
MKKIINYLSPMKHNSGEKTLFAKIIENRILDAMHFLKETSISMQGRKIGLHQLPWFLIIGSTGAGKTTLLANSGIKFILNKKIKPEEINSIPPSDHCDWWVTANAVLVDIPGCYTAGLNGITDKENTLFPHFLHSLQKQKGKAALQGIVVAISLTELMDKQHSTDLVRKIAAQLTVISDGFGHLPVYFNITKCDLLPGFLEFFADYGMDELTQVWGINIPSLADETSLITVFTQRFNQLIKRLNEQLIWRLHHERNPYTKVFVKDFPLHVEKVKEAFVDVLKKLSEFNIPINFKGIYLTSAIQHPEEQDNHLPQTVQVNAFQQALILLQNPILPGQAYFIKQFILQVLSKPEAAVKKQKWKNVYYALAASLIITFAIVLQSGHFVVKQFNPSAKQTLIVENSVKNDDAKKPILILAKTNTNNLTSQI